MKVNSPELYPAAVCPRCKAQKLGIHPQKPDHAWCAGCGVWTSDEDVVVIAKTAEIHRENYKKAGAR